MLKLSSGLCKKKSPHEAYEATNPQYAACVRIIRAQALGEDAAAVCMCIYIVSTLSSMVYIQYLPIYSSVRCIFLFMC